MVYLMHIILHYLLNHIMHQHLQFKKIWNLTSELSFLVGQCEAYVDAISNTPILPKHRSELLQVALIKGAQATTAIEGNTLSEEEIEKIYDGASLPPSKEYQEHEVKNIINAFNILFKEVVNDNRSNLITPELICRFHEMVGRGLGKHFDAEPGRFRSDSRVVGLYRGPDYREVPSLMAKYCEWLRSEFHYENGQSFGDTVIQAIVAHINLEWIHPFGDGNGRTSRLLEFYILLRGGLPDIASHILSNHYNQTRPEYYRHFDDARHKRDLNSFLMYALLGFRDGLKETLQILHKSQFEVTWSKYVYDAFKARKMTNKRVFNRQRNLALSLPHNRSFTASEIVLATPEIARDYANIQRRTVLSDLNLLTDMKVLAKQGSSEFRANKEVIWQLVAAKKEKVR